MLERKYQEKEILGMSAGIFALGALVGFSLYHFFSNRPLNADQILSHVKEEFSRFYTIEGSWIEVTPVPWQQSAVETDVYYGGITTLEDDEFVQYEFIADAYTGTVIDIYSI